MNLFKLQNVVLHSGERSHWKIECDELTLDDWRCLARLAVERLPAFGDVEGVPMGGIPFALSLAPYITRGPTLLVDDVYTTGTSMSEQLDGRELGLDVIGCVAFARHVPPTWIVPLWTLTPR